jgi:hypothetical protein
MASVKRSWRVVIVVECMLASDSRDGSGVDILDGGSGIDVAWSEWKGEVKSRDTAVQLFQNVFDIPRSRLGRLVCGAPYLGQLSRDPRHRGTLHTNALFIFITVAVTRPLYHSQPHPPFKTSSIHLKRKDANNPIDHLRIAPAFQRSIFCGIFYRHTRSLPGPRIRPR